MTQIIFISKNMIEIEILKIKKRNNTIIKLEVKISYCEIQKNTDNTTYTWRSMIKILDKMELINLIGDEGDVVLTTCENIQVNIINKSYLRTDRNNIREDNLGDMDEF